MDSVRYLIEVFDDESVILDLHIRKDTLSVMKTLNPLSAFFKRSMESHRPHSVKRCWKKTCCDGSL